MLHWAYVHNIFQYYKYEFNKFVGYMSHIKVDMFKLLKNKEIHNRKSGITTGTSFGLGARNSVELIITQ
jgi:hypothetical protein